MTENIDQLLGAQLPFVLLDLELSNIGKLNYFLQRGFLLKAQVGCSVQDFLCEQIGLNSEYVEERVQGVFLDNKPVDDIQTAVIKNGSRLTISGAMPGLVGVALRRGLLAVFRHSITYRESENCMYTGDGIIQLKLLNLLLKELGPEILGRGIYVENLVMKDFFESLTAEFWSGCRAIYLDGEPVDPEILHHGLLQFKTEFTKLSITT